VPFAARALRRPWSALAGPGGARRLLSLLLAVTFVLGSLLSGRSYYFCVALQQVVEDACDCDDCPVHEDVEDERGPSIGDGCCEEHRIGELPRVNVRYELPRVPPAPLATLPDEALRGAFAPSRRPRDLASAPRIVARPLLPRAGPCSSSERCIALQVFRC